MKQNGTVKWFNDEKGFGFITGSDGKDVFVHHTGIIMKGRRKLEEGQRVSYSTKKTEKGIQAYDVEVLK